MSVPVLPDNAPISDYEEPEGFWDSVHSQVDSWARKYGEPDDESS